MPVSGVYAHAGAMSTPRTYGHVVVIGAGMGGLAAAAAVARHAGRVTILERDELPSTPAFRTGVPQSRHAHALLPGGLAALERLLPGLEAALLDAGGVPVDVFGGIAWMSPAGWMRPFESPGRTLVSASRELIEWVTRQRVLALREVTVRSGVEVTGLAIDQGRIVGVDVRPRGAAPGEPTECVSANLVVDASGRRSPAPEWLAAAGYDKPAESRVDAELAYSSRTYRRVGDELLPGYQALFMQADAPRTTRMGVLVPIEGDRWLLTVAGTNGDLPPTDENGFREFTRGLRSPLLADLVEEMEPLTAIVGYRRTANVRRHYERLAVAPEGFVALGDATCAFNPVYGQGMSAAALSAEALDRTLAERAGTHAAQKAIAEANAGAWMIATGEDRRYPGTRGGSTSLADRVVRRYFDRVIRAAAHDQDAQNAFADVLTLLAPPDSLLKPGLAARVLGRRLQAPPADLPLPTPRRKPVAA
jgi:flavin-dependent dehydrogenase